MEMFNSEALKQLTHPDALPRIYANQGPDNWFSEATLEFDKLLVSEHHVWLDEDTALELLELHTAEVADTNTNLSVSGLTERLLDCVELREVSESGIVARPSGDIAARWESRALNKALGPRSKKTGNSVIDPLNADMIWHKGSFWLSTRDNKWQKTGKEGALQRLAQIFTSVTPILDPGKKIDGEWKQKTRVPEGAVPPARLLEETLNLLKLRCSLPCGDSAEGSIECHSERLDRRQRLLGASYSNKRVVLTSIDDEWGYEVRDGHNKNELWYGQRSYRLHESWATSWEHVRAELADKAPTFWGFVSDCARFLPDSDQRDLYQQRICQMVGQFAVGDTMTQKLWLLAGKGGTGKSVLQNLITEIVGGPSATFSTGFMGLGDKYAYANMSGKVFCNITEMSVRPSGAKSADWDEAANTLKAVLGGDTREARMKYVQDTPAMSVSVSAVAACNELPTFGGREQEASAWKRRMLPIPFRYEIAEKDRDVKLSDKLKAEIADIAGIVGHYYLHSVWKTKQYAEPQCAVDMLQEVTTSKWECVLQALELDPEGLVAANDCKNYWAGYMQQKLPRNGQNALSKSIQARFGVLAGKPVRGFDIHGSPARVRYYEGIRWRDSEDGTLLNDSRELVQDGEGIYADKSSEAHDA